MKTIALVANTSWSIFNFRLGLIRHLVLGGYRVVVIAPKDSFTSNLISEGIEYHEININNYGTNPFTEVKLIIQFIKLYKALKPDLVFHYTIKPNIYGSFASAYCKIPSIIITTGLGHLFEFKNIAVRWITLFLYRIACFLTKEVWFLNSNDQDVFIYKRIVKKSKTRILKSEGINTDWFKPNQGKQNNSNPTFLFAGRILKDKGILEFIEASKIIKQKYPHITFEVLGFIDQSNPNSIPYEQILIWQRENTIKYLGETSDVRPFLQKASCLVFPSFYREGVSRVLMEAASMETPIITTENVGCKEIVEHNRNGFICNPKNVNSLVQAIEKFVTLDPNEKLVMGKLGRLKMIREFDESIVLKTYDNVIQKILSQSLNQQRLVKSKSFLE